MAESTPQKNLFTDDKNPILPILFILVVTAVLIAIGAPRPSEIVNAVVEITSTSVSETVVVAVEPTLMATPADHRMLMAMGLEEVNSSSAQTGMRLFNASCTACHGSDAKGINGLGKTLIGSDFVDKLNDDDLVAFLIVGRAPTDPLNTTGQAMPARGNNPGLTDADLHAIVDYIRALNGATVINDVPAEAVSTLAEVRPFQPLDLGAIPANAVQPSSGSSGSTDLNTTPVPTATIQDLNANPATTPQEVASFQPLDLGAIPADAVQPSSGSSGSADLSVTPTPTVTPTPLPTATPESSDSTGEEPILVPPSSGASGTIDLANMNGQESYTWSCSGCHGQDGTGNPAILNSDITGSSLDDATLKDMLINPMPIIFSEEFIHALDGGYPMMTSEQLDLLIAYLNTLQK